MPTTHPGKRAAATCSSGEMPQKHLAKTASSGGGPQTHRASPSRPRCNAPGIQEAGKSTQLGAAGEYKQAKSNASPSRNIPLSRFLARQQRRARPSGPFSSLTNIVDGINAKASTSSSLGSHHGYQDREGSSVEHRSKERAFTGSTHNRCTKDKPDTALRSGTPQKHFSKLKADTGSSGEMRHKHRAKVSDIGLSMDARHASTAAKGCKQPSTNHGPKEALTGGKMPHKCCTKDKANMGLNGGKHSGNQIRRNSLGIQGANNLTVPRAAGKKKHTEGNTSSPRDYSQHTSQQLKTASSPHVSTTITDGKEECAANETSCYTEEEIQELNLLIQNLNKLGLGEDIKDEDFLSYSALLPEPPEIDMSVELKGRKLKALNVRLALYRIKYYKFAEVSKNIKCFGEDGSTSEDDYLQDDEDDKELSLLEKEEEFSPAFLENEAFFKRFEEDGKLDWCFHPDHVRLAALDDYQRLVPRNYGGYEYVKWNKYRSYLNSYEIEQEYLKYCEQLSKQLKWMEDYIILPPLQWGNVCSRGALQALKIATSFSKITVSLAYTGYYDCVDSMRFDIFWHKELDGIYFEIWQRVTQGMSFREALREVYDLKRFPLRDDRMKYELENGSSKMEKEFRTCTAGITEVVTGDKARKLIAVRLKKLIEKPKGYEDYIRKKICIAQDIGVIPMV